MFKQNIIQKRQNQLIHEKALAEDASVFQYDEVYDDIQNKRNEEKQARKTADARKPKYINKLLETAEKRKKEYERRIERQVQKEREAEGEQFKDKESFVTSAYRQKLEEMRAAEELEKREAYLEAIGDVTKQQDLSGFYRHLYSQQLGDEKKVEIGNVANVEEKKLLTIEEKKTEGRNKKKNYRKRKSSDEEKQSDEDVKKSENAAHLPCNLDADSDFSIESSDSENEKTDKKKKELQEIEPSETAQVKSENIISDVKENSSEEKKLKSEEIPMEEEEKKPKVKIDIWKKRTVGEVFEQALQRYFERKAMREQTG